MHNESSIRKHITLRYVFVVGVLLLVANILLGAVMLHQSKQVVKTLIDKNMLDISNCAAGLMDGDVMRELTADDVGGPAFNQIREDLYVFMKRVDIKYIYAIRKISDDEFIFTVDPDPVDPGRFGEPTVVTPALQSAGNGQPAVDFEPYEDRWGTFYTAYTPVFDSRGDVTAIIGVDFGYEWFGDQIRRFNRTVSVISISTILAGAVVMFLIMNKLTRRFTGLEKELTQLSRELDTLGEGILGSDAEPEEGADPDVYPFETDGDADEIEQLSRKVRSMHEEIGGYLADLRSQAKTDGLTRIANSSAYHTVEQELDEAIRNGDASFHLTIFDINDLKGINDRYGHFTGDEVIRNAAKILSVVFGKDRTYRIGGDEFAVVMRNTSDAEMDEYFAMYEQGVDSYNKAKAPEDPEVRMARGTAAYRPGEDRAFLDVFKRADEAMYANKALFYSGANDRRHRRED